MSGRHQTERCSMLTPFYYFDGELRGITKKGHLNVNCFHYVSKRHNPDIHSGSTKTVDKLFHN